MGCQRGTVRRVRLTDQALVAVAVARRSAAELGRPASAGDVLLGLATEPEGWAGRLLRRGGEGAVMALARRATSLPPGLAPLGDVVSRAAHDADPRPPGTADLLLAVARHGGEDVADLLASCGFPDVDLAGLERRLRTVSWYLDTEEGWGPTVETVTLSGPDQPRLDPAAARSVARVRAAAGGAVDLLVALDLDAAVDLSDWLGSNRTDLVLARLQLERDEPRYGADGWDRGLDAVIRAGAVLAGDAPVSVGSLLQATLIAGGTGPLAVVEAARAAAPADDDE